MCSPVTEEGFGLRSIRVINDAAMLKLSWEVMFSDSACANQLKARFFKAGQPCSTYRKSSIWPGIKRFYNIIKANTSWIIGDGSRVNFWKDKWLFSPIVDLISIPADMQGMLHAKVCDFIKNGSWCLLPCTIDTLN